MGWIVALVVVVALLVGSLLILERVMPKGSGNKSGGHEYEACGPLLTAAEAAFYPVLAEAAMAGPEACLVMCKVRLGDLIRPRKGLDSSSRATHANKIDRKHVDFVVVRASDFGVVAAVELDDSSHQRKDRKERDGFVDGALEAAGVRVVRVKWGRGYDLEKVAGMLWGT